jgi:hypothetical protein
MRIVLVAALAALAMPNVANAQRSDPRSLESLLKNAPAKGDDARTVNANLPELVNIRLSQLEEDLQFTAAQMPLWKT